MKRLTPATLFDQYYQCDPASLLRRRNGFADRA